MGASLAVAAWLLLAGVASAHSGDRNRDRIPDRWEKQHHLSLQVKQTKRDQDHDGLNNLGEYRANTDPRNADTDGDGIGDEQENAGTIGTFSNGVLTITLAKGGTLTGLVGPDTEIECHGATTTAKASDDGPGDDGPGDDEGDDDQGEDGGGGNSSCGPEALTAGRTVSEAELKASNGQAVFEKLELGS
jgi:hypothetical protein